ncbi:MAG TPA: hypothetical protein VIY49_20530 [Bryobacteraceae bacterium]
MPQWLQQEISQADSLAQRIADCSLPRRREPLASALDLRLSAALPLIEGLGGSTRALLVRQLLRALGFDEHLHLQWRVEHKLVQALVLRAFLPEAIPVTCGLDGLRRVKGAGNLRPFLADWFPNGYVIKATLGDSSGEAPARHDPELIFDSPAGPDPSRCAQAHSECVVLVKALLDEKHVVQERLAITTEYRVHSIEEDVIEDLTFRRYDPGSIPGERDAPNEYVRSLLRRLPDALVGGSLLAWDIALLPAGDFVVIEVNFSGFHPAFKRGFHCSGYFHDQRWGACDTARLLNYVARVDGVDVTVQADRPDHPIESRFYLETAAWQQRLRGQTVPLPAVVFDPRPETELVAPILEEIDAFAGPRRHGEFRGEIELRLSDALRLLPELAASSRALVLRQALLALGFDERRLTVWRLEHKLLQAHVFQRYAPDSMPETCGFDRLTYDVPPADLRRHLRRRFPGGFVIKSALGDCSGVEIDARTEAALAWLEAGRRFMPGVGRITDEEFVVQERKNIRREYRVHTIEDRVIEDLTVHRHHGSVGPGERAKPNGFVEGILDALPAGITSSAHLGWDVALLDDGSLSAIEINVGGIHTIYNAGFHSSGFYHHRHYGAIYSARFLLFLERAYQCRIAVVADAPDCPDEQYFYSEVADWKQRC